MLLWECVWMMAGWSNLPWSKSDLTVGPAWWGCTPVVHWAINVPRCNQPSPHTTHSGRDLLHGNMEHQAMYHYQQTIVVAMNRIQHRHPASFVWGSPVKVESSIDIATVIFVVCLFSGVNCRWNRFFQAKIIYEWQIFILGGGGSFPKLSVLIWKGSIVL